jgi:hypothetical protein
VDEFIRLLMKRRKEMEYELRRFMSMTILFDTAYLLQLAILETL